MRYTNIVDKGSRNPESIVIYNLLFLFYPLYFVKWSKMPRFRFPHGAGVFSCLGVSLKWLSRILVYIVKNISRSVHDLFTIKGRLRDILYVSVRVTPFLKLTTSFLWFYHLFLNSFHLHQRERPVSFPRETGRFSFGCQTAVWTICCFLFISFTAYSNFVHTFGIKRRYTVLVSEGEPQIPHWRHPIFFHFSFSLFSICVINRKHRCFVPPRNSGAFLFLAFVNK